MLQVYHSNRMERLAQGVADLLRIPLSSPLAAEVVVVSHPGLGRWLQIALAQELGVAANIHTPLPARFVWDLITQALGAPQSHHWDRDEIAWRIFAHWPELLSRQAFAEVNRYLQGQAQGADAWRVAQRVADLLDKYQVYRPDWMRAWGRGEEAHWQAQLWQLITADQPQHRVAHIDQFMGLWHSDERLRDHLPERILLFGLSSLPPQQWALFQMLAEASEVHLFFHNPSDAFWGDLVSERWKSRVLRRLDEFQAADQAPLLEVGHPLLASFGQQGQQFLNQLYEQPPAQDHEAFTLPDDEAEATLLRRLQEGLRSLDLAPEPEALAAVDESIQLHACHGPLRECQVLSDFLLHLFATRPELSPRDVVVMMPDIETYVPYIEAVFATLPADQGIPYAIADRAPVDELPLVDYLQALLWLPESRFEASEILHHLEISAVARRCGLTDSEVTRLGEWMREAQVRWGYDAQTKADLGLPADGANTWRFGLDRLLAGVMLAPEAYGLFAGIAPVAGLPSADAEAVGKLALYIERLQQQRQRFAQPHPLAAWGALLEQALEKFVQPREEDQAALALIREAMAQVTEAATRAGFDEPVSLAVYREALTAQLREPRVGTNFLAGAVTFCAFQPMRSIPFKVVCMLGMEESAYPRQERFNDFDLMQALPRAGDRSRRADDRYAFLEALLCAREQLYISYSGRDPRDDSERQPSTLVSELCDFLDQHYACDGGPAYVRQTHALQPFSAAQFDPHSGHGYSRFWCSVAEALAHQQSRATPFVPPDVRLSPPEDEYRALSVESLIGFCTHPLRALLQRRLGLYLETSETPWADEEPYQVDGLEGYQLRDALLQPLMRGESCEPVLAWAEVSGLLPHGSFAAESLERQRREVTNLADRLREHQDVELPALEVEQRISTEEGAFQLSGWLQGGNRRVGLLRARSANINFNDLARGWVEYLLLCAAQDLGPEWPRGLVHVGRNGFVRWHPGLTAEQALTELRRLLTAYWQGLQQPWVVLPQSSWAYLRAEKRGDKQPLRKAQACWSAQYGGRPGDGDDPYIALLLRDRPWPYSETDMQQSLAPWRTAMAKAFCSPGVLR